MNIGTVFSAIGIVASLYYSKKIGLAFGKYLGKHIDQWETKRKINL